MADDGDGQKLSSNVEVNSVPLSAVSDADEDAEVLGFAVMSTTGELIVPREWLLDQWDQHDLPESILPTETWSSSAYKRAMFHLLDGGRANRTISTNAGATDVSLSIRKGDGNQKHVTANVWFSDTHPSAQELDIEDGGEWRQTTLGITNYDADSQDVKITQRIDESHPLAEVWNELVPEIREGFETHKVSHNGDDMRDVIYNFTRFHSASIPLRDGGAVYFVPASDTDTIESLASIWSQMNEKYKLSGRSTEVRTIPVISDTDRRDMIEQRAAKVVRDEVDRVLEDAFDTVEDPDNDTPEDEIVSTIEDALGDHSQTAEVYNSLVDAKISVREVLEQFKSDVSDEAQNDLIESTLERLDEDAEIETDGGQERGENGQFI